MNTNWYGHLDEFGRQLLDVIPGAYDAFHSATSNPVSDALKDPTFVETYQNLPGFSRMAVCRAAVLCQMQVFDRIGGPEGDRRPKALRRHWYSYFKSEVAQPLGMQMGDFTVNSQGIKELKDEDWSSRLSQVYAELVDSKIVTYRDLWVDDASRMFDTTYGKLYRGLNLLICVEKDSLFADFKAAARAIGATALYSGKGKSSKAAIEKVLRESFDWSEYNDPFENDPLVVLHISDYDYDGQAVIGPTFAEQARRYTDNIIEARIGVNPKQLQDAGRNLMDAWYNIKVSNKGYQTWADEMAIFQFICSNCGTALIGQGREGHNCPECGSDITVEKDAVPHGFEVESLRTREYYALIADAFMRVVPFSETIEHLREECLASVSTATDTILSEVLQNNSSYQDLLKEFDRLEEIKKEFEQKVRDAVENVADGHESDWADLEDDPEPQALREHLVTAAGRTYANAWRPFSTEVRTDAMVEWLHEDHQGMIDDLVDEEITW